MKTRDHLKYFPTFKKCRLEIPTCFIHLAAIRFFTTLTFENFAGT